MCELCIEDGRCRNSTGCKMLNCTERWCGYGRAVFTVINWYRNQWLGELITRQKWDTRRVLLFLPTYLNLSQAISAFSPFLICERGDFLSEGWVARSLMPGSERCAVIITRGYASSTESPRIVSPLAASTLYSSGLLWSLWLPRLSCHSFSDHESAIGFQIYLLCFDNLEQVEKKCMNPDCHHPLDFFEHLPSVRQLVHN